MTRFTKLNPLAWLFVAFLCLASTLSFGQGIPPRPRIPVLNWGNEMGTFNSNTAACVRVPSNDILEIELSIGMARNDLHNFPPLYVSYDWGGYAAGMTAQITAADLTPVEINGHNVYEARFTFPIEIDGFCSGINPSEELLQFDYVFDLLTMDENFQVEPYPVIYEGQPLFPSHIFPETGGQNYTPNYSGQKFLCCEASSSGGGHQGMVTQEENLEMQYELGSSNNTTISSQETTTTAPVIQTSFDSNSRSAEVTRIFPNPASNFLNIDLQINSGQFYQIDLIDLKGTIVKSVYRDINTTGKHLEVINIEALTNGIYFCKIHSQNDIQVHKVSIQ